jgi:hypothetical protein
MSTEEFGDVCQRVHNLLRERADHAKEKRDRKPSARSKDVYVETSKDVFVFVHLMELVEHMTNEIGDLRQIIASMGYEEDDGPSQVGSFSFGESGKKYLN